MQLTDDQKQIVAGWIEAGASLNDIQKRLQEELEVSMTYLDVRLLVSELNLVPKEKEKPKEEEKTEPAEDAVDGEPAADDEDDFADDLAGLGGGKVAVSIDQIARPNAMISGKATFSDGEKAEWYIDPMGRLGLDPQKPGYRPSEQDVMAFQVELQKLARSQGL